MQTTTAFTRLCIVTALVVASAACQSTATDPGSDAREQRQAIDRHARESLDRLYLQNPETRAEIESAPAYAVFDLSSVNAVLVVGQRGKGVLVEKKSSKRTYMKAARAGTGPGVGYQELRQIFAFKSEEAIAQFKVGGKVGGDVSASVTLGTSNAQQSFNPYVKTYQITERGAAVQANWGGTAYLVDPDLN